MVMWRLYSGTLYTLYMTLLYIQLHHDSSIYWKGARGKQNAIAESEWNVLIKTEWNVLIETKWNVIIRTDIHFQYLHVG